MISNLIKSFLFYTFIISFSTQAQQFDGSWSTDYVTDDNSQNGTGNTTLAVGVVSEDSFIALVNVRNDIGCYLVGYRNADSSSGRLGVYGYGGSGVGTKQMQWASGFSFLLMDEAKDLAARENLIYVANNDPNHNILVFELMEDTVKSHSTRMETGEAPIWAIDIDGNGRVYVTRPGDLSNAGSVLIFESPDVEQKWGSGNNTNPLYEIMIPDPGELRGIAVNNSGNIIYLSNYTNGKIYAYVGNPSSGYTLSSDFIFQRQDIDTLNNVAGPWGLGIMPNKNLLFVAYDFNYLVGTESGGYKYGRIYVLNPNTGLILDTIDVADWNFSVAGYSNHGGGTASGYTSTYNVDFDENYNVYSQSYFGWTVEKWKYSEQLPTIDITISDDASISLTSPTGAESWQAGISQNITWTSQDVQNVKIEFTLLDGNNMGWACGDGIILKTADQGESWVKKYENTAHRFYNIFFHNNQVGWSVGEEVATGDGIIIKSTNGGDNWILQKKLTGLDLRSISFIDSQNGWVIGESGTILYSSNGGQSWEEQNSTTDKDLFGLHMANMYKGWAVGQEGIILQYNGIYGWSEQLSNTSEYLLKTHFIDDMSGWAAGANGTIVNTTNGGNTWTPQNTETNIYFKGLYFNNSNLGWAVGVDGTIIRTSNGGSTWLNVNSNQTNELREPFFIDSQTGWIAGFDGVILKTTDGGQNWSTQQSGSTNYLWSIYFTGSNWRTIVESTPSDGSYSWTVPNTPSKDCRVRISDAQNPGVFDISNGVFEITRMLDPQIIIQRPTGGEVWEGGTVEEIQWLSQDVENVMIIWSEGSNMPIVLADNVSASLNKYEWTVPNYPTEQGIITIRGHEGAGDRSNSFTIEKTLNPTIQLTQPNGGESWEVGTQQEIFWTAVDIQGVKVEYTYDNGANWMVIDVNIPDPLAGYVWTIPDTPSEECKVRVSDALNSDVSDMSDGNFSIIPASELSLLAPNGGEDLIVGISYGITWTSQQVANVNLDFSINNGTAWTNIVTSTPSSGIYSWEVPNTPAIQGLVKVSDASNPELFDVSDSTFLIKVPTSMKDEFLSGVPTEYALFQNFPNPFNPQTTIFYSLPEESYVEIKVYDVIGKEVKVLVSEHKPVGNYQVAFNGHELNSGIYLYRIQAGRYTETRKMLLIK